MDQPPNSNWRSIFEHKRPDRPRAPEASPSITRASLGNAPGYDDGHSPAQGTQPAAQTEIAEDALATLALDQNEYRPWILQRGRSRPVMMLHLRRFDPRSGLWAGWAVSYPALNAVEYVGGNLISLDFGSRHFVLEGRGFGELVDHLQAGTVLCVQEFSSAIWPARHEGPMVSAIRDLKTGPD